jgi:hypothetical protein
LAVAVAPASAGAGRRPAETLTSSRGWFSGSIARKRWLYSSVRLRDSWLLRTMVGVSSTITSERRLVRVFCPNNAPTTGILLRPGCRCCRRWPNR